MRGAFEKACFLIQIFGCYAFIIPDELPSLLSVIYSNIPTIKKGTDSRIGWGFRLGDRADFQVLVELGPQTYTQPLGNQEDKNTNRKRNTLNNLANTLYAQQQDAKNQIPGSEGAKWLSEWRNSLNRPQQLPVTSSGSGPKPGLGIGEIDAKSVIPDDSVIEMQEVLHKISTQPKKAPISKETTTTTTTTTTTQKTLEPDKKSNDTATAQQTTITKN